MLDLHVTVPPEIERVIRQNAPVAIGVSGGKDSCAVAIAVKDYLDEVGHQGPKILIHADLGRVEWKASLPTCQQLSQFVGYPLTVVRRQAGDMLTRWQQRWRNNVQRYVDLACVKVILPWSTPSMRFCTSELKSAVIASALKKQFPGRTILSVTGVRSAESSSRAKTPVCQVNKRMASRTGSGLDWNAIKHWATPAVYEFLEQRGFPLHEAYVRYKSTRVSCVYCIMGSYSDLVAATNCPDNREVYQAMVALEIESSFSFQSHKWLGDVAPHWLTPELQTGLATAKDKAAQREVWEKKIPKGLEYASGWPQRLPTPLEAETLAEVRRHVGALLGLPVRYTTGEAIRERFEVLMAEQVAKETAKPVLLPPGQTLLPLEIGLAKAA